MKRTILLAFLAILPLLASAAGTATVRVTNAGSVPIVIEGRTIRPSATASFTAQPFSCVWVQSENLHRFS